MLLMHNCYIVNIAFDNTDITIDSVVMVLSHVTYEFHTGSQSIVVICGVSQVIGH